MKGSQMKTVLALALALAPLAAHAEDFTFTVPVRLSNLPPEITAFQVNCGVNQPGTGSNFYGPRIGGTNSGERPITGGAFSGDITLAFNASPTADPSRAGVYGCELRLIGTVVGRRMEFAPTADGRLESIGAAISPPVVIPATGASTLNVRGTLKK